MAEHSPSPLGATPDPVADAVSPAAPGDRAAAAAGADRLSPGRLQEELLQATRELTLSEVAAAAGVEETQVRTFWHALGLHIPAAGDPGFTPADAEVIGSFVAASRNYSLSPEAGVSLVRAMGHSLERLVSWQTETIVEHIAGKYEISDAAARRMLLDRLPDVAPLLERGLVMAWHRHLAAIAERIADQVDHPPDGDHDELPLARAVGLADVVGFTTRTADLGAVALADYVQGFEALARDVVAEHGGRVVKTVGDALLFVADDPQTGARVALGLVQALGPESEAPLRVGLVWGRVLARFGDIFGPSVALAARLCDQAGPGRVLVDEQTSDVLAGRFLLDPLGVREVAGIGDLRPVLLIAEL